MAEFDDIGTTTTPPEMGRSDWDSLLGRLVTLHVEDTLDRVNIYTGRVATVRDGVGEVVLEDVTKTRHSGEVFSIARRCVPLCNVRMVVWLNV